MYIMYTSRYARTSRLQQNLKILPENPIEVLSLLESDAPLSERQMIIRRKIFIKPQDLARANERLRNEISENVDYRIASNLVTKQQNSEEDISIRIKRCIEQIL